MFRSTHTNPTRRRGKDCRRFLAGASGSYGRFGPLVQGNRVGTDVTGTHALANGGSGILVRTYNNTIGGTATGAGNLISGNTGAGVRIDNNSSNIVVEGNFIGTDVTGTQTLGNGTGVEIVFGSNNLIGGTTAVARNVISGTGGRAS